LRAESAPVASFVDLGVPPRLVEALRRRGVERPFPIQVRTLPDALAGRDVLGRAATGSGKTLAFGLPVLARLATPNGCRTAGAPRALALVPSRELALQTTETLAPLATALDLRVVSVVGGTGYTRQASALNEGVDVLVATPGRLVDLIERGSCRLDRVEIVAVDEADYMADLGFLPVVTRLLRMTPPDGQRLLFSATLDRGVATLVEAFLNRPAVHAVAPATAAVTAMTHRVFLVERDHKVQVAAQVAARPARTLFFVRTKHGADRLAKNLRRAGVEAAALHGNLAQNARERVVAAFAAGQTRVLVATDVAARGLHVDDVDLVIHYDPPADHKAYLHRSGRTARAGSEGTVVTLVQADQLAGLRLLHRDAAVEATAEPVAPGHSAVLELGTSGRPVEGQEALRASRRTRPLQP
jgi:superfamily II DNA/RNA helicase